MKKTLILVAAMLFPGLASAADMAVKAPPPAPPVAVYNWTGFYVGGHVGGSWTDSGSNFDPQFDGVTDIADWNRSPETYGLGRSSVLAGVHAGYNWQAAPNFVIGIEGDWSWTNNDSSQSINTRNAAGVAFVPASPGVMSRKTDWLASARGRLGVLVTPNLLLYGTGGAAFADTKFAGTLSSLPPGTTWAVNFDDTRVGWVAGGGGEWAVTSNWLLRARQRPRKSDCPCRPASIPGRSKEGTGILVVSPFMPQRA